MSRPFGRVGATCELAPARPPPPPTDPEVYFLKYINKVVSAKVYVSSLKLKDFAKYPRIESDMSNLGRPMN